MNGWLESIKKLRFYLVVGVLNVTSIGLLFYYNNPSVASSNHSIIIPSAKKITKAEVSGKPVLLRVPSINLELPIDEGHYNPADATWTLSGYHAHFAMLTTPANNKEGNTLVYGHNNKHVFGPLKNMSAGAEAEILTDNGHKLYYSLESSETVQPDDLSIFTYEGPPILTLQTCTGNWHELRTLSKFSLNRVVKYNPNAEADRISRERLFTDLHSLSNASYPEAIEPILE